MGFYKALDLLKREKVLVYDKEIDCDVCNEIIFIANVENIDNFEEDVKIASDKLTYYCSGELCCDEGLLSLHVITDKDYEYTPDDELSVYDVFDNELYFKV